MGEGVFGRERVAIVDHYTKQLINSGYNRKMIREIIVRFKRDEKQGSQEKEDEWEVLQNGQEHTQGDSKNEIGRKNKLVQKEKPRNQF